jgi:hypothetical protein
MGAFKPWAENLTPQQRELVAKQASKQMTDAMMAELEGDEVRAIRDLAYKTFGQRATCFVEAGTPGVVNVGFFQNDDRGVPPWQRGEKIVARGRTHREVSDQIRLWLAQIGTPSNENGDLS